MEQNDHSLDNTPLLRAIARMQTENSRESREAVLDIVISQAQFLAPADIVPETEGKEAAVRFQLLTNQEGQPFFPAFTGWDELRKLCGPKTSRRWPSPLTTMPAWSSGTTGPPASSSTPWAPASPLTGT